MRRFVLTHQHEGFFFVAVFQPIQRLVGDQIRTVTLESLSTTVHLNEVRVVVTALSGQYFPIVEANWVGTEVPLSDHCGLVARFFHQRRKRKLRGVEAIAVSQEAIEVAVLAR